MFPTAPGLRVHRRTAAAVGAVALLAVCAAPAAADDPAPAPGLVLEKIAPIDGVRPGGTFTVPARFAYTGTEALGKVWLKYTVSHGLSLGEVPSNCRAFKTWGYDEIPTGAMALCEFDQPLKPGVVYAPEGGLKIGAMDRALYERLDVSVTDYEAYPGDEATSGPVPGTGPALKLVEQPDATPYEPGTPVEEDAHFKRTPVTAANTADFQVLGGALKGRVGDTVDLRVGFVNAGPAWVQVYRDGVPLAEVLVKLPAGTTVTKQQGCEKVSSGTYRCPYDLPWADEDEEYARTFKVRIDKAVAGAKGSATLVGEPGGWDTDQSNDKAAITLQVTGGGGTAGGGSSSGGSSSGGGSGSAGGSSSTGGSGTGGTGGGSSTGGSVTGSTDGAVSGDLASTGSDSALPLAGAAAAAVGAGAAAVLVVRRRRSARG
ncbi:hypothetical protein [Streptomyces sp. NPDC046859]|uniref:hypothetical protein n=1 Tax=Streptomyces sp. NPDC046859 TaxID=3155734 RepID=UPI0033D0566D